VVANQLFDHLVIIGRTVTPTSVTFSRADAVHFVGVIQKDGADQVGLSHIKNKSHDHLIQKMVAASEYGSPIVLVNKKDGTKRLWVEHRRLNKAIVKDRFPLPLIEDKIHRLSGAMVFSTLDLRNGFFHVEVAEKSQKFTSFVTPSGRYQFLVPFGLSNSPSVFQRLINAVFCPLVRENVISIYMDDLVIPSVDEGEGVDKLKRTLEVAAEYGLQIKWKKCQIQWTDFSIRGEI
jgi:Reverse transcriptase (RNA-dependent DNA polymerase)